MKNTLVIAIFLGVLGMLVGNANAQESRLELAAAAEHAYLDGLSLVDSDPSKAHEQFLIAASGYQELIDDGVHSAGAWFNLGNALLRADKIGDAIVAYRKAERIDPSNDNVAANLAEARRRVDSRIEPDATNMSFTTVASWWHPISPASRLWIAMGAWILFWTLLSMRFSRRRENTHESEMSRAAWLTGIWATIAIAVIAAGTLIFDTAVTQMYPVGVLTGDEVVLRSGNGDGFGAIVEEPLQEGVEFTILESRPGWWRIELADGTIGWIPTDDAESI